MKATLDIPEDVLTRARDLAARESVPLDRLTEEGLRWVLEHRERPSHAPVKPVVVGGAHRSIQVHLGEAQTSGI